MTAPRVIRSDSSGSRSRRLERAPEIREREQRDVAAVILSNHFVIERARGLTELRQQIPLSAGAVWHSWINGSLVRVRIESAERAEKYLPVHAESVWRRNRQILLGRVVSFRQCAAMCASRGTASPTESTWRWRFPERRWRN